MAKAARTTSRPSLDAATRLAVLSGPEQMLKTELLRGLRKALEAEQGEVETIVYDGKATELADVLDELRSYGLMQQHKIVVVDDADQFVSVHREALARYAASPVDTATLVFRSVRWNRGKLDKLIEQAGAIIKCEPLTAPAARDWLIDRAEREHGRKLARDAADLLVAKMGTALGRLDGELAKLAVLVGDADAIDRSLVEQVVGRGSDEEAWAVQEALLKAMLDSSRGGAGGPVAQLHEIVDVAGQPDVLVGYFVADLMRKLHMALLMRRKRTPDGAILRTLNVFGSRQTLFMEALRRLDEDASGRLFDRIVELDRRAKTGFGDAMRNLECFCAVLADEVR